MKKLKFEVLIALPGLLLLTIFVLAPLMAVFMISFTRWPIIGSPQFIGLENYRSLLRDWFFLKALRNTLYYTTLLVPSITGLSFSLALVLRALSCGREVLKAVYVFPMVVSLTCTAAIWKGMFLPFGPLNQLLTALGIGPIQFLSAELVIPSLCLVLIWRDIGYYSLFFLAGLEEIPREVIEAAMVDGAGAFQRFRHVIWPMMKPVTFLVSSLITIGSFMIFTVVYIITGGGPFYSSQALLNYIYEVGWQEFRMGYAAASAVIYFVILFTLNTLLKGAFRHD